MKKILLALVSVLSLSVSAHNNSSNKLINLSQQLLGSDSKLTIGGYGEVHYNQVLNNDIRNAGLLDPHRMVLFFGYNFSEKTKFVTEIEMVSANTIWVEQMFLQQTLNSYIDLRAGVLLIPMGLINEYHEPTNFNGVERPIIDNLLAPSTWREVGIGASGTILPLSMKYQLYLINGPSSYDGTKGLINGATGFRGGRQNASKTFITSPNYAARIDYFGINRLSLGLSGYVGNTQSKLYDNLAESNHAMKMKADSSVVGISMIGADARYNLNGLELRGQFYYTLFSNTEKYNKFTRTGTGTNVSFNDVGTSAMGYYVEAGYNVFRPLNTEMELVPFVRYQTYDLHHTVNTNMTKNSAYNVDIITAGLTLKLTKGAVVKTDVDFAKAANATNRTITLNAGFGLTF